MSIQALYKTETVTRETKPGCWNVLTVNIFHRPEETSEAWEQIGSYERNYSSLYRTFYPFEQDSKHYALYSRDYTSTRVMSLPDCKDLGGEERDAVGFCPVEFYVPELCVRDFSSGLEPRPYNPRHDPQRWAQVTERNGYRHYDWPDKDPAYVAACEKSNEEYRTWDARHPYVERYAKWGLVSGCIWGDDSSWKVEYLDLSQIGEGKLTRAQRFGYFELPHGVKLCDAVDVDAYEEDYPAVRLAGSYWFRLDRPEDPGMDLYTLYGTIAAVTGHEDRPRTMTEAVAWLKAGRPAPDSRLHRMAKRMQQLKKKLSRK